MQTYFGEMITGLPSPYGDINFYSRSAKWAMDEHSHPYYQLILVTGGVLTLTTACHSHELSKGDLCIIPPAVSHSLFTENGYDQFGINLLEQKDERGIAGVLHNHIDSFTICHKADWFNQLPLIARGAKNLSPLSGCRIAAILDSLLLDCMEESQSLKKQDFVRKLLEFLNQHICEGLTLADAARELSLSQTQLQRLCRREFGCSVLELFSRLRLNKAYSLLTGSSMSILEISEHLGFCEQTYFCRFFRKRAGMTPSSYRRQNHH